MMSEWLDKARALLHRRKMSYVQTFNGEPGKEVLADLARFCRANTSTFHADPRVAANLDGRREVWLRIQEHLNLSSDELFNLTNERKSR